MELGYQRLSGFNKDIDNIINQFTDKQYMFRRMGYGYKNDEELPTKNKHIIDDNFLQYIKPEFQIKFRNYLKKINVIQNTTKKSNTKKIETEIYKDVKLGASEQWEINILKEIVDEIEEKYNINIKSKYVKLLRLGHLKKGESAIFSPRSKMIKLDKTKAEYGSDMFFDNFIHEYTHAIDMKENLSVELLPYYNNLIKKMYQETKAEYFNVEPFDSIIFKSIDIPRNLIYTGYYDDLMVKLGYQKNTYGLLKPMEFTATLFEDFIANNNQKLKKEIKNKCKEIIKKYYIS